MGFFIKDYLGGTNMKDDFVKNDERQNWMECLERREEKISTFKQKLEDLRHTDAILTSAIDRECSNNLLLRRRVTALYRHLDIEFVPKENVTDTIRENRRLKASNSEYKVPYVITQKLCPDWGNKFVCCFWKDEICGEKACLIRKRT